MILNTKSLEKVFHSEMYAHVALESKSGRDDSGTLCFKSIFLSLYECFMTHKNVARKCWLCLGAGVGNTVIFINRALRIIQLPSQTAPFPEVQIITLFNPNA